MAEMDPLTAGSYQSSGNDAHHQAANATPVTETWSRSKRGVVVGVVAVFGMLLVLGFAVLNTSPSSEFSDMFLLEDSSSSSPFVNFHTCPGTTMNVIAGDKDDFPFFFGEGVYEITILDFPDGPVRAVDTISLHHYPTGISRPRSVSEVRILGDGFHPSIYLQVDDGSDYLRVMAETRLASIEISLLCDGDYGRPFPPGTFPIRANNPQTLRPYPNHKLETVGIVNDVQPGTLVTASLGLNHRDRHVWVRTFVLDSPMMGIGMQDDRDMRDSSGRILAYEWESRVDITVKTYVAEH